jgi:TRAP-type C4-dicarboxylate transport system permease small subunit
LCPPYPDGLTLALVTATNIRGGRWITALIALIVLFAVATLGWLAFRWLRRNRNRHRPTTTTSPSAG